MSETKKHLSRRKFLARVTVGLGGLIGLAVSPPLLAAVLEPILKQPPSVWRDIGPVESFEISKTVLVSFENSAPVAWAGETRKTGAWVRRLSDSDFESFTLNCAHLGCPVRWEAEAELFLCPCHGGVYYKDGSVAAGPPPHGLSKYPIKVDNSRVLLRTEPVPITT